MYFFFLQVVVQSIEKSDDDSALKVLIELAESAPKFLRPQLEPIFQVCIKVSVSLYLKIGLINTGYEKLQAFCKIYSTL